MGNCIYLSDRNCELTYKKREHVISAGIGGKRTLPKGYVSDQANELFSKYELKCLRYSPLMIERARYGPGKRGSLNLNSIDAPDVLSLQPLMESSNQSYVCPLGFLFQNQVYILPQIVVAFDDDLKNFEAVHVRSTYQTPGNIDETEFHSRIQAFLMSNHRVFKKIDVPYNTSRRFTCIGCYKNFWYICSTLPKFDIDSWANQIIEKKPLEKIPIDYFGNVLSKPVFKYTRAIELEYFAPIFIHAKNCFNVLALFRGSAFVRQKIFDRFRQCILTNTGWETVMMPSTKIPHGIALWLEANIHDHEHVVVIYAENEEVMAFSVLYGKAWGLFKLGIGYLGESFSHAVICNFENAKETWYDSGLPF